MRSSYPYYLLNINIRCLSLAGQIEMLNGLHWHLAILDTESKFSSRRRDPQDLLLAVLGLRCLIDKRE